MLSFEQFWILKILYVCHEMMTTLGESRIFNSLIQIHIRGKFSLTAQELNVLRNDSWYSISLMTEAFALPTNWPYSFESFPSSIIPNYN